LSAFRVQVNAEQLMQPWAAQIHIHSYDLEPCLGYGDRQIAYYKGLALSRAGTGH
jgi:hypothetical protein